MNDASSATNAPNSDTQGTRCHACLADVASKDAMPLPIVYKKTKKTKTADLCQKCGSRFRRGRLLERIGMGIVLFVILGSTFTYITFRYSNMEGAAGVGFVGCVFVWIGSKIQQDVIDKAAANFSEI